MYCFECSPQDKKSVLSVLRHRAKEIGVEKLGSKCRKCGIDKIYLLEFHHRNPEEKDGELSDFSRGYDLTKFMEELNKCDLLCANCHREFHYLHSNQGMSYKDYLEL